MNKYTEHCGAFFVPFLSKDMAHFLIQSLCAVRTSTRVPGLRCICKIIESNIKWLRLYECLSYFISFACHERNRISRMDKSEWHKKRPKHKHSVGPKLGEKSGSGGIASIIPLGFYSFLIISHLSPRTAESHEDKSSAYQRSAVESSLSLDAAPFSPPVMPSFLSIEQVKSERLRHVCPLDDLMRHIRGAHQRHFRMDCRWLLTIVEHIP